MKIQAEISLYPLKENHFGPYIDDFLNAALRQGLTVSVGSMSSVIAGEREAVFQAVSDGFAQVSDQCKVVLVVKFSNACPASSGESCTGP
ncbi:MAG: hypothetical protein EHM79_15825 [Geobacter sp.]|nr:MAG: hypothetical protein EHM79_15825 [Geobacter sp.]